ncbi:hypothetical protein [Microbacterium sp. 2RAF4]|uniref:hypothetical protein n=1 Tax=Microbacterium sp. 2RAF4 TaxID=3232999 RepID=UPI003F96E849
MDLQQVLDTREGPLAERWAQQHIEHSRVLLFHTMKRSRALPPPTPASWLGKLDTRTEPFETSQQVRVFAQVAAENLQEVNNALKKRLPLYSLYSMIRAAMESASLGLWILDSKNDQIAASRTLRIYRQNIESDRTLWKTVVGRNSGQHDKLSEKAEEAHRKLKGINPADFEKAVKSTDVIAAVDRLHPAQTTEFDVFTGLEVWRICSAVTHANQVSLINIMERHPEGALGESVTRTSRLSFVASFYSTALFRAKALLDSFEERSLPPKPPLRS